jgi:acyl carrier protein
MQELGVLGRLEQIFRDELDDDRLVLSEGSGPDDVDGWDSLANIRIVAAIESAFGFEFDIEQIESVRSVSDLLHVIKAHSKDQS